MFAGLMEGLIEGVVKSMDSDKCAPAPNRRLGFPTLMSRPQPPIIPVSRLSFSRVAPGMRSIHPHKWHGLETGIMGGYGREISVARNLRELGV